MFSYTVVMTYYTYIHRTAEGNIFYVGKGSGDRAFSGRSRSEWWRRVVEKHGLAVEVVLHGVEEHDALSHERFLIASLRLFGARLVNMTDGGDTSPSKSPEVRAKMSAALRGKPKAKRCKERTGEAHHMFGKQMDQSVREKISASLKGKFVGENHPKSKPVVCVELDISFVSALEAVRWLRANGHPKARAGNVSMALNGKRPSAYGYTWAFSSDTQSS